jgi:hypothetical protein
VTDLSSYAFSRLRDGDLALYRGVSQGLPPVLLAAAETDPLACLRRLEREYALKASLDAAWAARPVTRTAASILFHWAYGMPRTGC